MLVRQYKVFTHCLGSCQWRVCANIPLVVFVPGVDLPKDDPVRARVVSNTFALVNCLFLFGIDAFKLSPASGDSFNKIFVLVVGRDALVLVDRQDHDVA